MRQPRDATSQDGILAARQQDVKSSRPTHDDRLWSLPERGPREETAKARHQQREVQPRNGEDVIDARPPKCSIEISFAPVSHAEEDGSQKSSWFFSAFPC